MSVMGYFTVDKEEIFVDTNELKRRLSLPYDFDVSCFDDMLARVMNEIMPKVCFVRTKIEICENTVDFGAFKTESRDLAKNLSGCSEAFVFAVTIGHSVDRLLSRMSLLSPGDFFICDAAGSAIVEGVCDVAENKIKAGLCCKARFSPGYGDFPLSVQRELLKSLDAEKRLGITLTDSLLMLPQKSITAVMGVKE